MSEEIFLADTKKRAELFQTYSKQMRQVIKDWNVPSENEASYSLLEGITPNEFSINLRDRVYGDGKIIEEMNLPTPTNVHWSSPQTNSALQKEIDSLAESEKDRWNEAMRSETREPVQFDPAQVGKQWEQYAQKKNDAKYIADLLTDVKRLRAMSYIQSRYAPVEFEMPLLQNRAKREQEYEAALQANMKIVVSQSDFTNMEFRKALDIACFLLEGHAVLNTSPKM